ncbi:MAG TPA: hypothetical protein VEC60_21205, partial [Reyranella sp.]|nr:hypothetical protein [Reyranella sp.]
MSALPAALRRSLAAIASSLALLPALGHGQELPFEKVSNSELRQALIWTRHLELWQGDPYAAIQKATRSWQAAKGYKQTDALGEDQTSELLAEAVKQREALGWSILQDKPVGLSVGVPTRLVKLASTRPNNGGTTYDFDGVIGYTLGTRYGDVSCANIDYLYTAMLRQMRPTWKMRSYERFAMFEQKDGRQTYMQVNCHTSGIALASVTLTDSQVKEYGVLFGALADSLTVSRSFNATALPRPKIDESPFGPGDMRTDVVARSSGPAKLPPNVDGEGKSTRVKLKSREGDDLTTREVFEKAGGAVYVVKAER